MLERLVEDFSRWHQKNEEELANVASILGRPLSNEPIQLINELCQIEGWNHRVVFLLSEANSFLEKFQYAHLPQKGDRTETQRKVELAYLTSDYRKVRDQIELLADAIKQRLILGESILSWHKQFKSNT